ncbi:MAG TPA: hypothetical protein VIJ32_07735 [Actinomycetes bacterium]
MGTLGIDSGRILGRHRLPQLQEAGAKLLEDPGGDTLTLAGQAEQQMLGAQPVALQAHRLAPGQAEHQRGGLGHRQVEPHDLRPLSPADGLLDPAADGLHLDP